MRKYKFFKLLAMSAFVLGAAVSCDMDIDEMKEVDSDAGTELKLSVSQAETPIVLNERDSEETGLSLTWTTGSNYGTGNAIEYTIELDKADGNWESAYSESLGRRTYAYDFTVEALNEILADNFGAVPGQAEDYKARVVASVYGHPEMEQSSEVRFTAITYSPVPGTLYIIGDCTEGGWDASLASAMTRISGGVFTFEATMEAGQKFRFITTLGSEWPAYIKAEGGETSLRYAETAPGDVSDIDFAIAETSRYTITVNLLDLTVTYDDMLDEPLYMIGSSTPGGWDLNSRTEMTAGGRGMYTWSGTLVAASDGFKFITGNDWWPGYVKANDDPSDMGLTYYASDPGGNLDRKFSITETAEYRIEVNLLALTVNLEKTGDVEVPDEPVPFEALWLIGDASAAGWSLDDAAANDAVKMTSSSDDPYTFTWTGDLKSGELKLSCDLQRDFKGKWYMPESNGKEFGAGTETIILVDSSSDATDNKWMVTAGNYTITINQISETMTVVQN